MSPPILTELWSATYLSVEGLLLVFALGVPGLVVQIITPEAVRRVVERNGWSTGRGYIATVAMVICMMLGTIWCCHEEPTPEVATIRGWAGAIGCSLVIVACFVFWFVVARRYARSEVVKRLQERVVKRYRDEGLVDDRAVEDLAYLGEHGECGSEKDVALAALSMCAFVVQSYERDNAYDCASLQDVVRGIVRTVDGGRVTGDERDVLHAVDALCTIERCARARRSPSGEPDGGYARKSLCELAEYSLQRGWEGVALKCLDAVDTDTALVFRIGACALSSGRSLVSSAALSRLEACLSTDAPVIVDRFFLIAMCARMRATSWAGKVRAGVVLQRLGALIDVDVERTRLDAIEWFTGKGRVSEVDSLFCMGSVDSVVAELPNMVPS